MRLSPLPSCTFLTRYVLDDIANDEMDVFFSRYWIVYCLVCSGSVRKELKGCLCYQKEYP